MIEPLTSGGGEKARRFRRAFPRNALCFVFVVLSMRGVAAPASDTLQETQNLIQRGELARARTQLAQLLKTSPSNPVALNMLGIIEAQEGHYRAAESSFEKALKIAPNFTGAYLNLGRLYQQNSSQDSQAVKKGVATYERLLKFEPANAEANYQCALLLMTLGSYEASLARLTRLPPEAQDRPQPLAVQCADHGGLKNQAQAEVAAGRLLKHPDLVEADVLLITPQLLAQQNTSMVTRLLRGLADRRLASAATLHDLARLYQQAGKLDQARAMLEEVAQKQGAATAPLLVELAHVADRQEDHQGALGYLAHARDLDPDNASIHYFFGVVCEKLHMDEEAYRAYKRAVDLSPDDPYYNYALGASMLINMQYLRDAYRYMQKYCEARPDDPRGWLALGIAYFQNGNQSEGARKELGRALAHSETAPTAHYYLGRLANREGKVDEAKQELQKAVQGNPLFASAYAELGLLQMKQEDYSGAEASMQKALEISPNNYTANFNLMVLYQRTKDPRAESQARRFEAVRNIRAERDKEFFRMIEVRP